MLSVTPDPQSSKKASIWLNNGSTDEPGAHSLRAFICALASCRELHDALRLITEEVREFLTARFVAVVVFEDQHQAFVGGLADSSVLTVPMVLAGSNIGQINIYFDQQRCLSAVETETMEVVAAVSAVTLDNARRLQRERKRLAQAEAVNTIAPSLAAAKDLGELARRAVSALRDILHYDAARLLWCDNDGNLCSLSQSTASNGESNQTWQDASLAARALANDAALIADDLDQTAHDSCTPFCLRTLLAAPVRGKRGVLGIVEVGARSPRAFDNADVITLSSLASQIAASSERLAGQTRNDRREGRDGSHDLLSLIAHDLRGPLSLVKGYAATLIRLGESVDVEKRKRFLSGIGDAADRLSIMVDHLVGVSRIETGQFRPNLCLVDLTQLVTETVERLRPKLAGRPISLELPGKGLPVRVDRDHVDHAVSELLLTAARQSPINARITVRVVRDDSTSGVAWHGRVGDLEQPSPRLNADHHRDHRAYGVVEVRDEQGGQLAYQIERIMDSPRFESRAHSANRLELYVASKIIEAHGGRLWAENELGRGNIFGFYLPLSTVASGLSL